MANIGRILPDLKRLVGGTSGDVVADALRAESGSDGLSGDVNPDEWHGAASRVADRADAAGLRSVGRACDKLGLVGCLRIPSGEVRAAFVAGRNEYRVAVGSSRETLHSKMVRFAQGPTRFLEVDARLAKAAVEWLEEECGRPVPVATHWRELTERLLRSGPSELLPRVWRALQRGVLRAEPPDAVGFLLQENPGFGARARTPWMLQVLARRRLYQYLKAEAGREAVSDPNTYFLCFVFLYQRSQGTEATELVKSLTTDPRLRNSRAIADLLLEAPPESKDRAYHAVLLDVAARLDVGGHRPWKSILDHHDDQDPRQGSAMRDRMVGYLLRNGNRPGAVFAAEMTRFTDEERRGSLAGATDVRPRRAAPVRRVRPWTDFRPDVSTLRGLLPDRGTTALEVSNGYATVTWSEIFGREKIRDKDALLDAVGIRASMWDAAMLGDQDAIDAVIWACAVALHRRMPPMPWRLFRTFDRTEGFTVNVSSYE